MNKGARGFCSRGEGWNFGYWQYASLVLSRVNDGS